VIDSRNGIVIAGLTNGKIILYDDRDHVKIVSCQFGGGLIRDLVINPHDCNLIAGTYGDKIAVFDIRTDKIVNSCFGHNVI